MRAKKEGILLPFDPAAVCAGIWKRRWIIILSTTAFCLLACGIARYLMPTVYRTHATIVRNEEIGNVVELAALEDMSRLAETIELFRKKLGIDLPLRKAAKLVKVDFEKRSGVVHVESENRDPAKAADTANAFVDAYCEITRLFRRRENTERFAFFKQRLEETNNRISAIEQEITQLKRSKKVIDFSKQARSYSVQFNHYDGLYQEALARKREIDLKLAKLNKIIDELSDKVKKEEAKKQATLRSRTTLRKQSGRLKEKILEKKRISEIKLQLDKARADYEKYAGLFRQGLVSGSLVKAKKQTLDKLKLLLNGSPAIKALQRQIDELDKGILPVPAQDGTSALILKEMVLQQLDLRLAAATSKELIRFYKKARDELQAKLSRLPAIEAQFNELTRELERLDTYRDELKAKVDETRLAIDTEDTAFHVLQRAPVPSYPYTTKRKLLVLMFTCLGFGLGFLWAFAASVASDRLGNARQVSWQLGLPVLFDLNDNEEGDSWFAARFLDQAGGLSRLREGPYVLYITSIAGSEGKTATARFCARALARVGFKVRLVPADFRGRTDSIAVPGVEIVKPTPGSDLDFIGGPRFQRFMASAREQTDVVIVDGPPMRPWVDARVVAQYADGCILSLPGGKYRSLAVRSVLANEEGVLGAPVGVVLTKAAVK